MDFLQICYNSNRYLVKSPSTFIKIAPTLIKTAPKSYIILRRHFIPTKQRFLNQKYFICKYLVTNLRISQLFCFTAAISQCIFSSVTTCLLRIRSDLSEQEHDCCLIRREQIFRYIMARTSFISMA
jgi:hypothetical protein